ncbi:MAG: sugar phosphate isomerase/epimerase [Candidatus Riflebacteria bacterium]|nr:sugar phosphate isomerase/epimerase [Candidatus Riflebacteria bacterium]
MTEEAFALLASYELFPELYFSSHSIDNISAESVASLKAMLDSHKFASSMHAPFMEQDIGAVDNALRQRSLGRLLKTLEVADQLGSQRIVIHPGYGEMINNSDFLQWLQRATEPLKLLLERAIELNLKIAFENIYDSTPARLHQLLQTVDSRNAGICFDTGHYNLFSELPMQAWLDKLGSNILVCHIHDNDKSGDQHLAIGDGCIDYSPLITWYNRLAPEAKPVLTLEALNRPDVIKSATRINTWGL